MGCKVSKAKSDVVEEAAYGGTPGLVSDGSQSIRKANSNASSKRSSKSGKNKFKGKLCCEDSKTPMDTSNQASPFSIDGNGRELDRSDQLSKLIAKSLRYPADHLLQDRCVAMSKSISADQASYVNPKTKCTPLHLAVRLIDAIEAGDDQNQRDSSKVVPTIVKSLIRVLPSAVRAKDATGNPPLHYAIAPTVTEERGLANQVNSWGVRSAVVQMLIAADPQAAVMYMSQNSVIYDSADATEGCTPLYRVLQSIPDDFDANAPTVKYLASIKGVCRSMVGVGNETDGDKPLALLYRRFTRQFDLAEKFFAGDNSRPAVVEHRRKYKTAAGNTWKMIELLLRPEGKSKTKSPRHNRVAPTWRIVHRAVQVETPPDLLRYIVETNAEDLTVPDDLGSLPLHYAAKSKPAEADTKARFPAFYTKYVVDELLYKFPEAAGIVDQDGNYPLTLAAGSGKQWIGGGIKSLYDAYPNALTQTNLENHPTFRHALSMDDTGAGAFKEEKESDSLSGKFTGIVRDEQHDAIMLVQQESVDVSEVVTSMWAHEEDAGVQMLGCVAISKMASAATASNDLVTVMRIALSAVAAVVNSMKAHPNEMIVQEKACHALKVMASADGQREVSFVASGAVAAIVGAMQAHVSDQGVQEEACGALTQIILVGGSDRATVVASVSGLTAIVNAIAAHPEAVGVQRNGCGALRQLTEHPEANLPDLPKSQTEPLLQAARVKFPLETKDNVDILLSRLS